MNGRKKRFLPLCVLLGLLVLVSWTGCGDDDSPTGGTDPPTTITAELPGGAQLEMVWIAPGAFTMGSPQNEIDQLYIDADWDTDSFSDEGPQHEVVISEGFYLGKYELTQGQWEAVMGSNPSKYKGANRPVEQVSWYDVQFFVQELNQFAGSSVYRLPTEAEWEYACRAGTATRWSSGDDESQLTDYAWYGGNNSFSGVYMQDTLGTKDVGTKLPNPWGLYDMHGNVDEWCQDWYGAYSNRSQVDPTGPATGSYRVYRGGGFLDDAIYVRSASRYMDLPGESYNYVGFRLLRTP